MSKSYGRATVKKMVDEKQTGDKTEAPAFKAVLSDAMLLKDSLTAINELISEGVFKATPEGMYLTATDPTMVVLVDYKLLSTAFENYDVKAPQEIGINIDNFLAVLRRSKAGEKMTLELESGANKLLVTFKGATTRKFTIPVLDIEKGEVPEMNLDFPAIIDIKSGALIDSIEDATIVTDTVVLGASPSEFTLRAEGDLNKVEIHLEKGSPDLIGLNAKSEVGSKYSLEYLKKVVKGAKISDTAKIHLGKDYPLKVIFREVDKIQISYILAPRVED